MVDLEALTEKIYQHFSDISNRSYPLLLEKEEIKKTLQTLNADTDKYYLLDNVEDDIQGLCGYRIFEEEKYLQTTIFASFNHNKAFIRDVLRHFRLQYPDYTVHIGIEAENGLIANELKSNGYRIIDDLYPTSINPSLSRCNQYSDVREIDLEQWDDFEEIHQASFGDGYWNFTRIKDNFDIWKVFSIQEKNHIKAYIFVKSDPSNEKCEVFGAYSEHIEDDMRLIEHAVASLKDKERLYYFIENDNVKDLCEELGFELHGHYQAWGYDAAPED